MKKLLLFLVVTSVSFALLAQNRFMVEQIPQQSRLNVVAPTISDPSTPTFFPFVPGKTEAMAGNKNISRSAIGSSANVFGVLLSQQNCLDYSPSLDMLLFTHRKSIDVTPGNTGFIQASYSLNQGATWNFQMVYEDNTQLGRYPSGVIYNPIGNTDTANAFAVVAGCATSGGVWASNYFASETFAGTNNNVNILMETSGLDNLVRNHMNIATDGTVRIYGQRNTDDGTNFTGFKTIIYTGVFNSTTNAWTWTEQEHIPPYMNDSQGFPKGYSSPGMVWSKDGQTGFLVFVGTDSTAPEPHAYNPIVFKTTNGGTNWTKQPPYNFSLLPAIDTTLTEVQGTSGIKRAHFTNIEDLTIDANGNLHLLTYVRSHFSANLDSAQFFYAYTNIEGILFHVYQTATGWNANEVATVVAKDDDTFVSTLWFDARPQISKTPDETKIVFAWLDTDPILSPNNYYPDINVQFYDITNSQRSDAVNLTKGTNFDGSNYYMFLAPWSKYDAINSVIIPHITVSDIGATDADPVFHFYFRGIGMPTSINELSKVENLSVSQNYPNPANDLTMIDINLNKPSTVSIEIFNVLGQTVHTQSKNLSAGKHTVTVNVQNFDNGLYFYTVRAANSVVTKRMIKN